MQSEIMPVQLYQLSPQLASIQTQLRAAIANHQSVFGNYQQDPKNAVLRDKLHEMQVQIKNLSDHQTVIVRQLRGQLIQNPVVSSGSVTSSSAPNTSVALGTLTTSAASSAPLIVTPSCTATLAKPVGQMAPRPQLLTLPHGNLGIVVPFAHIQAQPTLVTLPGVLNQPSLQTPQSQPLVGLQLNASSSAPAAAILTPPASVVTTSSSAVSTKPNQVSTASSEAAVKPNQSVLRPIQPRPASPPIKVPQYTANNQSSQGQQPGGGKGAEKSNGLIHRNFSESDAKDLKGNGDQTDKDLTKSEEDKNIPEKMKVEFMSGLGLVTLDSAKAIQSRRFERKRRTTANPHYSYTLERRRNGSMNNSTSSTSCWLMGSLPAKRSKGKLQKRSPSPGNSCPGSPDSQGISGLDGTLSENKGGRCAECGKEGQLLLCGTCSLMYHLDCLSPPLATVPETPWSCPACIVSGKSNGLLSNGALSMVNSYITTKANKEDDRKKAQRRNADLNQEKQNLLERKNTLKQQVQGEKKKAEQMEESIQQKAAQIATLEGFIKHFRNTGPPIPST